MALSPDEIAHLANLAAIELTEEEKEIFAPQLDVIFSAVAKVAEADIDGVEPMSHGLPLENVFREDVVRPSLPPEDLLANAPAQEMDRFRVPRILGEAQ